MNTEVHNAFEVIKNGGIILYPTDTVWGIGCDATNEELGNALESLGYGDEPDLKYYGCNFWVFSIIENDDNDDEELGYTI